MKRMGRPVALPVSTTWSLTPLPPSIVCSFIAPPFPLHDRVQGTPGGESPLGRVHKRSIDRLEQRDRVTRGIVEQQLLRTASSQGNTDCVFKTRTKVCPTRSLPKLWCRSSFVSRNPASS